MSRPPRRPRGLRGEAPARGACASAASLLRTVPERWTTRTRRPRERAHPVALRVLHPEPGDSGGQTPAPRGAEVVVPSSTESRNAVAVAQDRGQADPPLGCLSFVRSAVHRTTLSQRLRRGIRRLPQGNRWGLRVRGFDHSLPAAAPDRSSTSSPHASRPLSRRSPPSDAGPGCPGCGPARRASASAP